MKLDDVFVKKDDVAIAVKTELNDAMLNYGYDKEAMNRINASEREKIAAQFEGDAQRILIVERAKAEAESKRLQGQGIADQRREIARGLEESVEVLKAGSQMLNDMVASFTASNQIGEAMKKRKKKKDDEMDL